MSKSIVHPPRLSLPIAVGEEYGAKWDVNMLIEIN